MFKRKMSLLNHRGQILVEAILSSLLMVMIMLAFQKLIELKKTNKTPYKKTQKLIENLNDSAK